MPVMPGVLVVWQSIWTHRDFHLPAPFPARRSAHAWARGKLGASRWDDLYRPNSTSAIMPGLRARSGLSLGSGQLAQSLLQLRLGRRDVRLTGAALQLLQLQFGDAHPFLGALHGGAGRERPAGTG